MDTPPEWLATSWSAVRPQMTVRRLGAAGTETGEVVYIRPDDQAGAMLTVEINLDDGSGDGSFASTPLSTSPCGSAPNRQPKIRREHGEGTADPGSGQRRNPSCVLGC